MGRAPSYRNLHAATQLLAPSPSIAATRVVRVGRLSPLPCLSQAISGRAQGLEKWMANQPCPFLLKQNHLIPGVEKAFSPVPSPGLTRQF